MAASNPDVQLLSCQTDSVTPENPNAAPPKNQLTSATPTRYNGKTRGEPMLDEKDLQAIQATINRAEERTA